MAIFDDACVIAAHILWNTKMNKNESHYKFKKSLPTKCVYQLCRRRAQTPNLSSTICQALQIIGIKVNSVELVEVNKKVDVTYARG